VSDDNAASGPDGHGPGPGARRVVVAGTVTDVGKTWVAAGLVRAWRRAGCRVAARKPAQSYAPGSGPTDAEVLGEASGEPPVSVCPPERWYPVPMAPPMAADALGRPRPTLADLLDGVHWPEPAPDVALLETAGGVRSPQADDGDVVDLVLAWPAEAVVLVAHAGLGTLDAIVSAADALPATGPGAVPTTVVLNRFDPGDELHCRNLQWLVDRGGLPVVPVVPGALEALASALAGSAGQSGQPAGRAPLSRPGRPAGSGPSSRSG